jgi:glutathione S-transferase
MAPLTLVIGNKNYSSWSLRPWLLLKHLGVSFDEIVIQLDTPDTREVIDKHGPSGRVPVLQDGALRVWDSLAICEYIVELTGRGWPTAPAARAVARAVSAEMHSGFTTLRSLWPMNARARNRHTAVTAALEADVERLPQLLRRGRPVAVRRILGGRCDVRPGGAALQHLRRAHLPDRTLVHGERARGRRAAGMAAGSEAGILDPRGFRGRLKARPLR